MPVRYEIDSQLGLILVVGSGVLRDDQFRELSEQLSKDFEARRCALELDDYRGVTRNELSIPFLRQLAEYWRRDPWQVEGIRVARVTPRDTDFGLSRVYEALRGNSPIEFGVFREMSEAEQWLGLPAGYVRSRGST